LNDFIVGSNHLKQTDNRQLTVLPPGENVCHTPWYNVYQNIEKFTPSSVCSGCCEKQYIP